MPLEEGGGNELENIVALCVDCHSAIHPDVEQASGDWRTAPRYPTEEADPRVCFVIKPDPGDHIVERTLLDILATTSTPGENVHVQSSVTVGLAPKDAKEARTRLEEMVENRGHPAAEIRRAIEASGARYEHLLDPSELPDDFCCERCGEQKSVHRLASYRVLMYDTDKRVVLCLSCLKWAVQNSSRRMEDLLDDIHVPVPIALLNPKTAAGSVG